MRHLNMIPRALQEQLDTKGHVTLPEFARAHAMRYERALQMVRDGVLGAVDFRTEGSTRPAYRIFGGHIEEFYRRRSNAVGRADLQRPKRSNRKPPREFIT